MKWLGFWHAVPTPNARPFMAAHLVDFTVAPIAPVCNARDVTPVNHETAPRGFFLACCDCLGLSEIKHV